MASGSSSGNRLAREIYDEFLVCKICTESYRTPKCLSCLHTFCEECIESKVIGEFAYRKYTDYRKFICPLCGQTTQMPAGGVRRLVDNFIVSGLSEMVRRQRPLQYPFCDLCKLLGGKHREAQSKCLDCDKMLCPQCVARHRATRVTQNHSLFDIEIEKDIECKEHEGEAIRFYCNTCEACVCVLCTFQEHQGHDVASFKEAVVQHKEEIVDTLSKCRDKIGELESQVDSLLGCEQLVKSVEQQVRDAAIELIREVRIKEQQLLQELHTIYGSECLGFIENRKDLLSQLENLRSTCGLAEMAISGEEVALLLLKNEVQDKLKALMTVESRPMPPTVNKTVKFNMSAIVDIGSIQDPERPLSSTMHFPRSSNKSSKEIDQPPSGQSPQKPAVTKSTKGTQTESKLTTDISIQTEARRQLGLIATKATSQFSKPAKYY